VSGSLEKFMNERIQQLAEQALQLVADEHTDGDESRLNTDSYHVKDLIQEKFAELIIKECAKIAGKAEYSDTWLEPVEDAIKQHFGVV
jgi:hypothetical protein